MSVHLRLDGFGPEASDHVDLGAEAHGRDV